ncbi:MAG: Hsp33 family molecular chaperone HslO [Halocynthiibacter sp.]
MTTDQQVSWDDSVLPFQLDASDIRGRVARLDGVLDNVLAQHDYPDAIEALVAEAAILTALIGQTIKLRWKLSLQIRGSGAVRIIATDYYAPQHEGDVAKIRAYASFDEEKLDQKAVPFSQIGKGYFAILIDQGEGTEPYSGITPIAGGSLAACAETYFEQSEQLRTEFKLSFGKSMEPGGQNGWRAGGIMIQQMPKASSLLITETVSKTANLTDEEVEENWNRTRILMNSVEELELVGPKVPPLNLLYRLFHEEDARVFDAQPVLFGCTCSEDRVRNTMSMYSAKDIAHMTTDEGTVTADCQFCGAHYVMDPKELGFDAEKTAG